MAKDLIVLTGNSLKEFKLRFGQEMDFPTNSTAEFLTFVAANKDETIWATQVAMAELFGCSSDNIGVHLKNIFAEGELQESATTEKISVVQLEGNRKYPL